MALLDNPDETPEETQERIDKLLEEKTKPERLCISCMEPIRANDQVIESMHGPYHGLPRTCVNGRD